MNDFSHLIDLASARLGGEAVQANDEFFAGKENLLKPEPPIEVPDKYNDRGKWMDGWESRRRRTPGHDWCLIRLGLAGLIHAVVVDTAFFRGNYPSHCSIDACGLPEGGDVTSTDIAWREILPKSELNGNAKNSFPVADRGRITHLRLNIYPDGGVARLRVMGEAMPLWTSALARGGDIDLASAAHGGYVFDTSDRFYAEPANMLMPYEARNTGDGWETKRRRGPGHDWSVIRLGIGGAIHRVELDTRHFKGNYPDSFSLDAADLHDDGPGVSADVATRGIANWRPVIEQTKLEPDHNHVVTVGDRGGKPASHVRLNIFPDGGVSRFRVFGTPAPAERRAAVVRLLNAMDTPDLRAALATINGAPAWIDRVAAARPFASAAAVRAAADAASAALTDRDWQEAIRHHPRIGERDAERAQSDTARARSAGEQSGLESASAQERQTIADNNRLYEDRFGHLFIVSAQGKSAAEIIAQQRARLDNDAAAESRTAAGELRAISQRRLETLLG